MRKADFEIIPEYKFMMYVKLSFFCVGFVLIISSLIDSELAVLGFFGIVTLLIGGFLCIFSSKKYLRIYKDNIEFKSKSIIKEFSESISIDFGDIREVVFLKRQFLIFGGRSPLADADAQTLYNENRIVFTLKDNNFKVIAQTGKVKEFKKAFNYIEQRIDSAN